LRDVALLSGEKARRLSRLLPDRAFGIDEVPLQEGDLGRTIERLAIAIFERRQQLIDELEASRGSKVLAIVHGQDWGVDDRKTHNSFDEETANEFLSVLRELDKDKPLDIILHTLGGDVTFGIQLARALKSHRGRKTAYVPFHAFSMGTMIALVCDDIVMGEHAVLGPIDPQVGWMAAADLVRLKKEKPISEIDDDILLLSYRAEKIMREMAEESCDLTHPNHKRDGVCELTNDLTSGDRRHGYPIGVEKAKDLGIRVSLGTPVQVFDYVELCRDFEQEPAIRDRARP
jgi:hypothetical protein